MNFANVTEWRIPEGDVLRVTRNNIVLWEKEEQITTETPFFVENIDNFNERLTIVKANSYAPTLTIEYSTDKITWSTLGTTSTNELTLTLNPGDRVYLRCNTTSWWGSGAGRNVICGISKIGGNILSLLYGSSFVGQTMFPTNNGYEFNRGIFYRSSSYNKLVDASKLLLPATTLNEYCYYGLFAGCTLLTSAPALPATTLSLRCYASMFYGCTSLTAAPALPATTLAQTCYANMFEGCTSLITAPALPATTLTPSCYSNMFYGCTALTSAPDLPATTLASSCYDSMFKNCSSLTVAPELNAQTLLDFCYNFMFSNCTLINNIKCLATTGIGQNSSTQMWLSSTASSGTFTKAAGVTWPTGSDGIPSGWTVVEV